MLANAGAQNAVACIDSKANVCSVQFSPTNSNLMAFGSANFRVYLYDLRNIQVGHRRPGRFGPQCFALAMQCTPSVSLQSVQFCKLFGPSYWEHLNPAWLSMSDFAHNAALN